MQLWRAIVAAMIAAMMVNPAWAQTSPASPNAGQVLVYLNTGLAPSNPCPPITMVSLGDPANTMTWVVTYASAQSSACDTKVASLIANFVMPPPAPTTLQIISTGTPALNGTYNVDSGTQARITSVTTYLTANGNFPTPMPGGTIAWPDSSGVYHTFNVTQWKDFANAVGVFAYALATAAHPTQPVTIP